MLLNYRCIILDDQGLYIDSVQHSFYGNNVLTGVFLHCKKGDVIGLLGRNGSGKSTLLKIIFGSLRASFKYQKLNGKLIMCGYRSGEIAYLPQDNFIPSGLTVIEAIELLCNRFRENLKVIDSVKPHLNNKFSQLSGGQRRLIECLIILYSDQEFVLLDEPFSQLSPLLIDEIRQHIKYVCTFKGIVVTDHYYEHIVACSTKIILLHNGCNYPIGSTDDLARHGYLPSRSTQLK
ncbi:MAG: ATP-binding cassette domain-containing protein [Pedobacter sp.]|nr:MAG: ATP-binding cassette domain-containing protein [Pedobacter sp.]